VTALCWAAAPAKVRARASALAYTRAAGARTAVPPPACTLAQAAVLHGANHAAAQADELLLVVGTAAGDVRAFSAATGELAWAAQGCNEGCALRLALNAGRPGGGLCGAAHAPGAPPPIPREPPLRRRPRRAARAGRTARRRAGAWRALRMPPARARAGWCTAWARTRQCARWRRAAAR